MTTKTPRTVLLVEDNQGFASLVRTFVEESRDAVFNLEVVDRLGTAVERADRGDVDCVLLDLGLPDSQGLDTFLKARARIAQIPIIVLTGMDDDDLALEAVWAGAQDFLVKGKFDAKMLEHTLRYAIEREGARAETDRKRQTEQRDREISSLHRLADPPASPWTPGPDGVSATQAVKTPGVSPRAAVPPDLVPPDPVPPPLPPAGPAAVPRIPSSQATLRAIAPQAPTEVTREYADLMELAQGRRANREIEAKLTDRLRALADKLGQGRAGPRDVVMLHDRVLRTKTEGIPPQRALLYLEEGRRMVLELMGHLVTWYRDRCP